MGMQGSRWNWWAQRLPRKKWLLIVDLGWHGAIEWYVGAKISQRFLGDARCCWAIWGVGCRVLAVRGLSKWSSSITYVGEDLVETNRATNSIIKLIYSSNLAPPALLLGVKLALGQLRDFVLHFQLRFLARLGSQASLDEHHSYRPHAVEIRLSLPQTEVLWYSFRSSNFPVRYRGNQGGAWGFGVGAWIWC